MANIHTPIPKLKLNDGTSIPMVSIKNPPQPSPKNNPPHPSLQIPPTHSPTNTTNPTNS